MVVSAKILELKHPNFVEPGRLRLIWLSLAHVALSETFLRKQETFKD